MSNQIENVEIFTDYEREVLLNDGAVIYLPEGQNVNKQIEARRCFRLEVIDQTRLVVVSSRKIEVAIYPDPERFFVPNSFYKATNVQDWLFENDAASLRERLGLKEITMRRPEVSEATEVIFRHFDETGVRLLGVDYKKQTGSFYPYIRTSTPTNVASRYLAACVAIVGSFDIDNGPAILDWSCDEGAYNVGVARWIVPKRTR